MSPAKALAAPLLVLALAACSGGGAPDDESTSGDAAAIRAGLAALFAGDHPGPREKESGDCFAEELIARTSPADLRDAGVLDSSYDVVDELPVLPPDAADAWVDAQFRCTDFVEESARAQATLHHGRIDPDAYAACLRHTMSEDEIRSAVHESLVGDWRGEHLATLGAAQSDCARHARGVPAGG